jgi:CARDB
MRKNCKYIWCVVVAGLSLLGTTITKAGANLTPFAPTGWSDKIVLTRTNGGTIDSSNLLASDSLYLDWAVINSGNANVTTAFVVALNIDGVQNQTWSIPSLNKNSYTYVTGYPLGSLAPGTHVFQIVADATGVVVGDIETNNSYSITNVVSPFLFPAPAPITPANGANGQMVVPAFSWTAVTNAGGYRVLIATNASDLPTNSLATNGGASVVLNAVAPTTNFSPTVMLNASTTFYWETHVMGANEEDGTWSAVQSFTTGAIPTGVTIIPTFDSSILNDPNAATIEATINAALSVYRENFSDAVTANITYTEMSSGLGDNNAYYATYSYSAYRAALVTHATTADDTNALAHLPATTTNPVNGSTQINLKLLLARALGLPNSGPISGQPDAIVYLNTSSMNLSTTSTDPTKYSLFSTVCHETDEAIGFGSALNGLTNGQAAPTGAVFPQDLFRYDGSGNRSFNTGLNSVSYFSFDGVTNLVGLNQYDGGDFGDWYSHDVTVTPQVQDAFLLNGVNPVPGVELRGLDAIGYTRFFPGTNATAPVLTNVLVSGANFQFTLAGGIGTSYVVQASSNLTTWAPFSTNVIPSSGATNMVVPSFKGAQHVFYRAVSE